MSKTAEITLAGETYTVRAFNMRELQRVMAAFEGPRDQVSATVLAIAMERAEPKLADGAFWDLEPTFPEISAAFTTLCTLAGLNMENPTVPAAAETVAGLTTNSGKTSTAH